MRQHTAVIALFLFGGVFVLGLLALASVLGPGVSEADDATMHNCPQAGKWAISVWDGPDGTDADQALDTCAQATVVAAYYIDPATQAWSRWFLGRPEVNTLPPLNDKQGLLVLGAGGTAPPSPTPSPTPVATPTPAPASLTEEGVAAVVKLVAAPEGTGLPGEPRVTVDPGGIIPIYVHVTVEESNAFHWIMLSRDEEVDYVVRVLKALHDAYPDVEGSALMDEVPIYFIVWVTDHKGYVPNWPVGAFSQYCMFSSISIDWRCHWPDMTGRYRSPYGIYEYQTIYDYDDDDWHQVAPP